MAKVKRVQVIDDETGEIIEDNTAYVKERLVGGGYRLYWNMPRKLTSIKVKPLLPRCKGYEALVYYVYHLMPFVAEDGCIMVGRKNRKPFTKTDLMRICKVAMNTARHVFDACCERGILRLEKGAYYLNPVIGCPWGIVTPNMFRMWSKELKYVMPKWAIEEMVMNMEGLG